MSPENSRNDSHGRWRAALTDELRAELHRYCARLMGSVIDGEDIVQDVFAKALAGPPDLDAAEVRPWLFRVAHNRAVDVLRARAVRESEPIEMASNIADTDMDALEGLMRQEALKTAVSRFVELPIAQRSAVILKDVLSESLADIADLLGVSVDAVKAHLARGRARLRAINADATSAPAPRPPSSELLRYVELFNRRDWNGLRDLLAEDVRLKQSSLPLRSGARDVGQFFTIYAKSEPVRLAPAWLEDREVIAVYEDDSVKPSYLMWLEWRDGRIRFIRDTRYVRYIVEEAELLIE